MTDEKFDYDKMYAIYHNPKTDTWYIADVLETGNAVILNKEMVAELLRKVAEDGK